MDEEVVRVVCENCGGSALATAVTLLLTLLGAFGGGVVGGHALGLAILRRDRRVELLDDVVPSLVDAHFRVRQLAAEVKEIRPEAPVDPSKLSTNPKQGELSLVAVTSLYGPYAGWIARGDRVNQPLSRLDRAEWIRALSALHVPTVREVVRVAASDSLGAEPTWALAKALDNRDANREVWRSYNKFLVDRTNPVPILGRLKLARYVWRSRHFLFNDETSSLRWRGKSGVFARKYQGPFEVFDILVRAAGQDALTERKVTIP